MRRNNARRSTRCSHRTRTVLSGLCLVFGLSAQVPDSSHPPEVILPDATIDTIVLTGSVAIPEDTTAESRKLAAPASKPVSVLTVNDSTAIIVMDDSTRIVVPFAGSKKKVHAQIYDNMADYSPFNPTAFVKKKYPLTVSLSELAIVSASANLVGSTTVSFHGFMPGLLNYQVYILGLHQGIWSLKNDAAAVAGYGLFSPHTENNPFYLHGRLIGSLKLFPRSALHFACSWTYLKYIWLDEKRTDTVDYYSQVSQKTILRGLSAAFEYQPFRRWKFFVHYFDYTFFLYEVLDRFPYTLGWGTRILFNRVSVDLGAALMPNRSGSSYYYYVPISLMPLPYLCINGHFGHQKNRMSRNPNPFDQRAEVLY